MLDSDHTQLEDTPPQPTPQRWSCLDNSAPGGAWPIYMLITPRAHARARGYVIGRGVYILFVVVYCILYISLHFFLEPIFYLPKYSLSEVYFNRDRLLIEFNGLWYSLAARQVFAAIANPDSLSFG